MMIMAEEWVNIGDEVCLHFNKEPSACAEYDCSDHELSEDFDDCIEYEHPEDCDDLRVDHWLEEFGDDLRIDDWPVDPDSYHIDDWPVDADSYRIDDWPVDPDSYRIDEWPEESVQPNQPYSEQNEYDLLSWLLKSKPAPMTYGWDLPQEPPKVHLCNQVDKSYNCNYRFI